MAKRKTREQKAVADTRHQIYHLETSPAQVSLPSDKKSTPVIPVHTFQRPTESYAYVVTDLRKTAFITGAILFAQVVIFFLLHRV